MSGTTGSAHLDGATVYDAADYVGWGEAASGDYVIEPGMWSLDNYGTKLNCFDCRRIFALNGILPSAAATSTRATDYFRRSNSIKRHARFYTPDRHLVFFGTETTIGDTTTQDDMFIRFSSQENH